MSQVTKLPRQRTETRRAVVLPQLSDERESYAGRFAYPARREVRRLMRTSARLADLAIVFPGAMYALATRRGPQESREAAMALIEEGAALKSVARTLELPLWLRRLPPEAFQKAIAPVPASESFTRRVATRLPAQPNQSALWLDAVAFGNKACHEDFSLWLADQPIFSEPGKPEEMF